MQIFTVRFQQYGVILTLFIALFIGGAPQMWGQTTNDEVVWVKYPENLLPGFYYNVRNAVYSPDGRTILVSFTGEEIGWHKADIKCTEVDAITGAFIREVPIQGIIQFSADGEYVYTFDWKKVRWPSLEVVGQFPLEETPSVEFHNFAIDEVAGVLLIVGNDKVGRFDLNTFEELPSSKTIYAKGKYPCMHKEVQIVEEGKYFVTYSEYYANNLIYECAFVWNVQTMDTTTQAYQLHRALFSLKQSPNRSMIGVVMSANPNLDSIFIINTNTFLPRYIGEPDNGSCNTPSAAWSHDSRYFITSSGYCNTPASVVVWDVQQGTAAYRYKTDYAGGSIAIYTSKDDKYILGVGEAGIGLFNFLKGTDVPLEPKVSSTLYPNPTNGNITIPSTNFKTGKLRIELAGLSGNQIKILYDDIYQGNDLVFNLSWLPEGTYFLKAIQGKTITTYKVIKLR